MNFKEEAAKLCVDLTERMEEQFDIYTKTLLEYNSFMNLTAITDELEIKVKHYLDSLSLLSSGKITHGSRVIDIGAGAGFPSLPCAIAYPNADFTMLDSLLKRVNFLEETLQRVGIKNASAIHARAEDGGRDKRMREKFDVATARAVADLSVLAEYALPFVKVGGWFLAMKGTSPEEEALKADNAIKALGGRIEDVLKIHIDPLGLDHTIIIIKKIKPTDKLYPRKSGTPSKKPL